MEIHVKVLFVEEFNQGVGWGGGLDGGFVAILNAKNAILQAAVRRTKAIFLTRNRNKAAMFA
jgi:hypothetical protein